MNIRVTTKIRVNGQDYASVSDMPPQIREAYERAMKQLHRKSFFAPDANASPNLKTSIVLNGEVSAEAGQTPADVCRLFDDVKALVKDNQTGVAPLSSEVRPSLVSKVIAVILVILGAAVAGILAWSHKLH